MFNGQFGDSIKEMFSRIKFGGVPSSRQCVYYINLQEIKGIKFGTRTPVNYFDSFYNAELFLRAFGTYSIKITNPFKFYTEVVSRNAKRVDINDINEQYLSEFLEAFTASINKMSVDGIRISHIASKSPELSRYMATELDEDWNNLRGFEVLSVGIASISYDEESKSLINMRNKGAMLGDPSVREGFIQGAIAQGIENAGSNPNGSANAFIGMGMGMNTAGGFMQSASQANMNQMQMQREQAQSNGWTCSCGTTNTGNFCQNCGSKKPAPASEWTCSCGATNTGKFCQNCGSKKIEATSKFCQNCGAKVSGKFCPECGEKL